MPGLPLGCKCWINSRLGEHDGTAAVKGAIRFGQFAGTIVGAELGAAGAVSEIYGALTVEVQVEGHEESNKDDDARCERELYLRVVNQKQRN